MYEDAARMAEDLPDEDSGRGVSAVSRIRSRAVTLERVAVASRVYAAIQEANVSSRTVPQATALTFFSPLEPACGGAEIIVASAPFAEQSNRHTSKAENDAQAGKLV